MQLRTLASLIALLGAACARDSLPLIDGDSDDVDSGATPDASENPIDEPPVDGGSTPDGGETPRPDAGGEPDDACGASCPSNAATQCDGEAPPTSLDVGGARISAVKLGGGGNVLVAGAGERVAFSLGYAVQAASCAALEIPTRFLRVGFAEGETTCSEAGPCFSLGAATLSGELTAPSSKGTYGVYATLVSGIGESSCAPFESAPTESQRIGTLCVE